MISLGLMFLVVIAYPFLGCAWARPESTHFFDLIAESAGYGPVAG
jgi:hypothetical protein